MLQSAGLTQPVLQDTKQLEQAFEFGYSVIEQVERQVLRLEGQTQA
jgi:hypothetical protein